MKAKKLVLLIIICILVSDSIIAHDKNWNNSTELSFVNTSGNTEVTTLSAKNKLIYRFTPKIETVLQLSALYGKSGGVKNSENYSAKLKGSYLISERFYASLVAGWSKDIFTGIDSKMWVGPALGYKLITGPKHNLNFEAGVEYVDEKYYDPNNSLDENGNDYFNGRAFTEYKYAFTEKSNFEQSIEFNYDFENSNNYDATSITSITTALSDVLSLKASYKIDYGNAPVPTTLKKTDPTLSVSLIINM
jgi:putative salt-induced outer membrane protein